MMIHIQRYSIYAIVFGTCSMIHAQSIEQRIRDVEEQLTEAAQELRAQIEQLQHITQASISVPEPIRLRDTASAQERVAQLEDEVNQLIKIVQKYSKKLNEVADQKVRSQIKDMPSETEEGEE